MVSETKFDSTEKIYAGIVELLIHQLSNPDLTADDITPETDFLNDLDADSLDLIEIIVALEESFDINIPDDLTFQVRSMKQAVDVVVKLREAKGYMHKS